MSAHGFEAFVVRDGKEAKDKALALIGGGSVGIGGSVTVGEIGLYDELVGRGNAVYWHWKDGAQARYKAANADFYVCSANAVTRDGTLVLTDGGGNRVAGLSFGTGSGIVVVGKNKVVDDVHAAVARIKSAKCSGRNASRLGFRLPCSVAGECKDCSSPQRICSVTAVFERASKGLAHTFVILVDEELGY